MHNPLLLLQEARFTDQASLKSPVARAPGGAGLGDGNAGAEARDAWGTVTWGELLASASALSRHPGRASAGPSSEWGVSGENRAGIRWGKEKILILCRIRDQGTQGVPHVLHRVTIEPSRPTRPVLPAGPASAPDSLTGASGSYPRRVARTPRRLAQST